MNSKLIGVLMILPVLSTPLEAQTSNSKITGFSESASIKQHTLEATFDSYLKADNLRTWMKRLSERPHHVGSPGGKANALYLADLFKSWGFQTEIEEFQVLFPTPKSRKLELISPGHFTAKIEEAPLAEDNTSGKFRREQLPVYNAYSIDGDVTGPLVYVNYGIPKDYETLAERGIDVKGKIVIARYGGSWRGIKPKVAAEHGAIGCLIYSDPKDDGYGPGTLNVDVDNKPITAVEAVRIALLNQPNVVIARSSIEAAKARTSQARAGLGPNVGVNSGYSFTRQFNGPSSAGSTVFSANGFNANATLRQLIFDFNHTRDIVRESAVLETAATQNLSRVQSDLALSVKQAFYSSAQDLSLVSVNESNVSNQQLHLALAQARLDSGLGLLSDVVRAQTAVADAIFNLNLVRNTASTSVVNLAALMGIDPRTPLKLAPSSEPQLIGNDVKGLVKTALSRRPEILQAQANLEASEIGVRTAKSSNLPNISGSFGLGSRGNDFPLDTNSFVVGATVQFTPFDSGLTKGRVREANANVVSSQAQLASAKLNVTQDVSEAYLNLRLAEQRVVTADVEIENAKESVRLAEGRYKAGVGTFIDLLDAQNSLITAQSNRVNAGSAVDQARASLNHAIGTPLPATRAR